ncbi:PREDICTED: transmembrane protein 41 homolog isoform X1 [Wasmannia auropunctata]|uniref:transmembrane protein 41 homolog isoform X1 n=1 Tax=Wasmannia auropunctata TaxID=64793 RepID=UPI0005EDAA47|nr:PREDICTED: transmembrane protein 41 homolog isoform X1 [Wasmannia auropunctata]
MCTGRSDEMARRNLKATRVKARVPKGDNGEVSTRRAIATVGLIFVTSLTALFYVYTSFPELDEDEKQYMTLPLHIEDAKNLGKLLERYKDLYYFQVLAGLFITYIFLQTFAIPGSIFLSILSGFLFRFPVALLLVCTCSAIGATLCYLLSSLLGRRLLFRYFPEKAKAWTVTVTKHRDNLLNYMLFLRMTPLLPNWFINLASPVIGVPMMPFTVGTFFGVAPPSFVAIQAGQTLHKLTSSSDAWSWNSVIILCVFALFSLLPVLYKQKLKQKFE